MTFTMRPLLALIAFLAFFVSAQAADNVAVRLFF